MIHLRCCRALPRTVLVTTPKTHELLELTNLPNIHFDYIGSTRVYHQHWKVLVYYNVHDLYDTSTYLANHIDILKTSIGNNTSMETILGAQETRYHHWKTYAQNVIASTGLPTNPVTKRGLFNFVGAISKTLFGTMSSDDAEYYNQAIDAVIDTNNKLARLVKNETHILQTRIIDSEHIQTLFLSRLHALQEHLEKSSVQTEHLLHLNQLISMFADSILIFESMLLHGELGQLHPNLFTPSELEAIVNDISLKYGQNQLVKGTDEYNYHHLLSTSKITIAVLRNHKLCFEIRVPILEETQFSALHLVPLPLIKPLYSQFVSIDSRYIFLDLSTRNYMPTTLEEISRCQLVSKVLYCERHVPKFTLSKQDPCLKLATRSHIAESSDVCQLGLARINHTVWVQLHAPNMWIGIFPACEYGQLNCPSGVHETLTLCKVFQLSLSEGCTLTTPSATLFSNSDLGYTEFNMTKLGLPKFLTTFNDTMLFTHIPEVDNIHINADALHDSIRTLDSINYEASLLESQYRLQRSTHVVWDTLTVTLICVFIFLIIYVCIRKIHKMIRCLFRPCIHYYSRCMITNSVATEQIAFRANDYEAPNEEPLLYYPSASPSAPPSHPKLQRHSSNPASPTSQRTHFSAL
jgi:hypothetical protein